MDKHVKQNLPAAESAPDGAGISPQSLPDQLAEVGLESEQSQDIRREQLLDRPEGRWNIYQNMARERIEKLSNADLAVINKTFDELQDYVTEQNFEFIPVFGYLSIPTKNYAELGKEKQEDVVHGEDVVNATLPDYGIDVVMSTVFRGRPESPGLVGGLRPIEGAETEGVVLRIPRERAEELIPVLLQREFFGESDLIDSVNESGKAVSNAMYAPVIQTVQINEEEGLVTEDGRSIRELKAVVFTSNPDGAKSITLNPPFGGEPATAERLAYMFAARGGFREPDGSIKGGNTFEYWSKYMQNPVVSRQLEGTLIEEAMNLSQYWPVGELEQRLADSTLQDEETSRLRTALWYLFEGIQTPVSMTSLQKPEASQDIVRELTGSEIRGTNDPQKLLLGATMKAKRLGDQEMLDILSPE